MVRDLKQSPLNKSRQILTVDLYGISKMTLVNTGSVWQLCLLWFDVCVDHSTWPVWRHQGHRQISFPLMSACRRIQQVNKSSGAVSFYLPPFPLSLSLRLSLSVFVPPPSASLNLSNLLFAVWKSPLYLSSRSSFVREWISLFVFSESQLIPPLPQWSSVHLLCASCCQLWFHLCRIFNTLMCGRLIPGPTSVCTC